MGYSNSSLVSYVKLSPNHSGQRTHAIDRITPHCVVGQLSASSIAGCFDHSSAQASCNYGIGTNGDIALVVEEKNRSWCSSSNANDQRAVTIECASDSVEPYAFNQKVYNKLVELCVDICRRNGKNKVIWFGDKDKTLNYNPAANEMVFTVHRWFANKSCPGNWMYTRMGDLANAVNAALGSPTSQPQTPTQPAQPAPQPSVSGTQVKVTTSALNIRSGPGTNYKIVGTIRDRGTYTITEVSNGWGKLKSGAGWISLSYTNYNAATAAPAASNKVACEYRVRTLNRGWMNAIAGPNTAWNANDAITDIAIATSKVGIRYQVHILGGNWLPWVTGYNINDNNNGYAGSHKQIDAIRVEYTQGGHKAKYRVATVNKNFWPYQYNSETGNGQDGYAGTFGQPIIKFELEIV